MSDPAVPVPGTRPRPAGRECDSTFTDSDGTHACARWSTHLGIHRTSAGIPEWLDDGTPIRQGQLTTEATR